MLTKNDNYNYNIDLVYLWVDGKDANFIAQKKYWQQQMHVSLTEDTNNARFVDNEELRYSLRSVAKNAPWIHKIFIVTNGQVPSWLDPTNPKIKLINLNQIMPKEALPTFNSCAIEFCIHNIPELSEHFLLANDDCFINKPISPSFFFDNKGRPIFRLKKVHITNKRLYVSQYARSLYNSFKLINKKYNKNFEYMEPHNNIDAYTISGCRDCEKAFSKEYNDVIMSKFRNETIQRIIIALYLKMQKKATIKLVKDCAFSIKSESGYFDISSYNYMIKQIFFKNPCLLCINDEPGVLDNERKGFRLLLESIYPDKQLWEKDEDNIELKEKATELLKSKRSFLVKEFIRIFLKNIFSVANDSIDGVPLKIIKILGIQLKIDLLNRRNIEKNYEKIIKKLRKKVKTQKIKVAFLVSENSKWGYQSLYDLFAKSDIFEPIVLITLLTSVHEGRDTTRNNTQENYEFFKNRGMNVDYLYKNNKYRSLERFKPDIVFYEQPWDIERKYRPRAVSKYALTAYCSYSYEILDDTDNYFNNFHGYLYKYFIEHELNHKRYINYSSLAENNCVIVGYPKLDAYLKPMKAVHPAWKEPEKIKVIYAPHHSFDNSLKLATFDKNHDFILKLAKSHPETTWIFKPHPRLKFALMKMNLMTEAEIDKYYEEWGKIGTVYAQGDYIDIFKSSDAMITDCLSFLAEYLPSQKPLIRLINPASKSLNELGEKVVSEYYKAHNDRELEEIFKEVVLNKNDYNKSQRYNLIKEIFDSNNSSASKIYNYLKEKIEN